MGDQSLNEQTKAHELDLLVSRLVDGLLTDTESARLNHLLSTSPDTVKRYHELLDNHEALCAIYPGDVYQASLDEATGPDGVGQTGDGVMSPPSWRARSGSLVLATTLATVAVLLIAFASVMQQERKSSIAKITGLSGSLIWTGDYGQIVRDIKVGTHLAGGTIEGVAPDSWFELQFHDGSTVMISGTSTLTFADFGQKTLRLREGRLSANVVPQRLGKPMLIHTRSAVLEVLGTQFDVEVDQASTLLNVNEGKVRLRRLSDGSEVDVPAQHLVIAEDESDLTPERVQASVNHWKSRLDQQRGGYGKWLQATSERRAAQKAIAMIVPSDNRNIVLYLLSIPVTNVGNSPITVLSDSRFVVRGRLNQPAKVYFGIGLSWDNGEFAGKFRGDLGDKQPAARIDPDGRFEVVYRLSDFSLDSTLR